ncbi:antibiotic biosynthesis monooxygenase [Amycolatopsis sp. NBC_00345]|uniref:putative quinol monooxygenase n=1 Tax=Amycolatopsis sp. NBC_00345 TaxID=2975955 RepID=UPI002E2619DB
MPEPGNISFAAYHGVGDARDVVLLERYDSREAFARHRETDHFAGLAPAPTATSSRPWSCT